MTNPPYFYLAPVEVVIHIHLYTVFVVHIIHTSQNRPSWLALTGLYQVAQEYSQARLSVISHRVINELARKCLQIIWQWVPGPSSDYIIISRV